MTLLNFQNPSDSTQNATGVQTMSSLQIAELTGKQHKDVLESIRKMEPAWEKIGRRKFSLSSYINQQNREMPMYNLTKTESLYVATKFNDEARAKLVLRWEELETKQTVPQFQIPSTLSDALRLAAEKAEEAEQKSLIIEEQEKQLQIQAPKVERYDRVMSSKGLITTNIVASYLGMSAIKLNKLLCAWGIQYSQSGTYILHAEYRNRGLAEHKPYPYVDSTGMLKTRDHLYWTQAGKEFILNLYSKKLAVTV